MLPLPSFQALTKITAIRNSETPNFGTILAAEICYAAIVPFAVVEAAFLLLGLATVWVTMVPLTILFPENGESRFDLAIEGFSLSAGLVKNLAVSVLWAVSAPVMNLLPVRQLETSEQAKHFFCC